MPTFNKATILANKLVPTGTAPTSFVTGINKLDPGLIDLILGAISPATPTPGVVVPTLGDTFRSSIPVAQDGDLITSNYHNSLRDAIIQLADQSGGAAGGGTTALAFAPAMQPTGGSDAVSWVQQLGFANRPPTVPGDKVVDGWMPVSLPHGSRVRKLTVVGNRTKGTWLLFQVQLFRQLAADTATEPLIQIIVPKTAGTPPSPPDAKPGTFTVSEERKDKDAVLVVDNTNYRYILRVQLLGVSDDSDVSLRAFRIECDPA